MGEPSYNPSREESEETRRRAVLEVSKLLDTAWHSTITKNGEYHFMNAISNAHRDNPKTAPDVAVETYLKYGAGASLASPERSVGRKAGKRQEIALEMAHKLCREKSFGVIVVLHDLNLAASWADRIVMMKDGQLKFSGSPQEVLSSEVLKDVYGVDVLVLEHPGTGRPIVTIDRSKKDS